jgi:hypothetical protein
VFLLSKTRTMEKVQKPSNSVCYTPLSEPYKIYVNIFISHKNSDIYLFNVYKTIFKCTQVDRIPAVRLYFICSAIINYLYDMKLGYFRKVYKHKSGKN